MPLLTHHSFSSLPPEVIANNHLYQQKIVAGEIKQISIPGELARVDYFNPADRAFFATREKSGTARYVPNQNPTRTTWLPGLRNFLTHPITPKPAPPVSQTSMPNNPNPTSAPHLTLPEPQSSMIHHQSQKESFE